MDKLKGFLEAMTLWNWLALIAALVLPFTALNAFLSLRSRYRDWRGIQNRKQFQKRLIQLERELQQIQKFNEQPHTFFMYLLERGSRVLVLYFAACSFLGGALVLDAIPVIPVFRLPLSLAGALTFFGAYLLTVRLHQLIKVTGEPMNFAVKIVKFITYAKGKGLPVDEDSQLIEFVHKIKTAALASKNSV